jgi:hypothetical protein
VKQQLWGLRLKGPVPAGSEVQRADDGSRVGRVTSVAVTPDGEHTALAFIKCKSKGAQVNVEGELWLEHSIACLPTRLCLSLILVFPASVLSSYQLSFGRPLPHARTLNGVTSLAVFPATSCRHVSHRGGRAGHSDSHPLCLTCFR